jgi:uncharacterized protein involved in response to NO
MTAEAPPYRGPALWSMAFRPFFLAAGAWAALAMAAWLAALAGRIEIPSAFDALAWHAHEMVFGFAAAAVGGFLLTAIPNWTGRAPLAGLPLALLVLLWLAGRCAVATSQYIGIEAAAGFDMLYLVALIGFAARELIAAGNKRNFVVVGLVTVLALANALIHLGASGIEWAGGLGLRLAILDLALLVTLIGGRIVPAFTRNWLERRGGGGLPAPADRLDRLTIAVTALTALAWSLWPERVESGTLSLLAAVAHAARLARWRGLGTLSDPLLAVLHLAYAWLAVGFGLLGAAAFVPDIPVSVALHALTAGAFGTMILAVMTRASLGHAGRPLRAGAGTVAAYVLVTLAALARLASAFAADGATSLLLLSGACWIAAYGLFVVLFAPMFVRPVEEA